MTFDTAPKASDCSVDAKDGYVHAYVGCKALDEIRECYAHIAALAAQHRYVRLLIVGDDAHNPVSHLAVRGLVVALSAVGVPAGFRLALVARAESCIDGYRQAEFEGSTRGLAVRVFEQEADAAGWLTA
jgi:hypothetical protein